MRKTPQFVLALLTIVALGASASAYVHQKVGGKALRWSESLVRFVIQAEGAPGIEDGSDAVAVRAGFQAWASSERSIELREDADPAQRARRDWRADDLHLVSWDADNESGFFGVGSGLVAVTPIEFDPATGRILDADILIDGSRAFSTSLAPGTFDVQAVVTHEVGHLLGLDHSAIHKATMNPSVEPGDTWQRSLEADDARGADSLYGFHRGARLRGSVVTETGQPISGAHVVVEVEGSPAGAALSDEEGRFEVVGLAGGSYVVYAEPLNGSVTAAHLQLQSSQQLIQTDFGTTFWGAAGRSSPRTPEEVSLPAGADRDLGRLVVGAANPLRLKRTDAWVHPGAQHTVVVEGRALSHADEVVVPGLGIELRSRRIRIQSVSLELDVAPQVGLGLRSVRLIRASDEACVVLSGGIEVRRPAPTLTSASPPHALVGESILLSGLGLQAGARVLVGPSLTPLTLHSQGEASFVLPAIPNGTYDLVVENPDGQVARISQGLSVSGSQAASPVPSAPETPAQTSGGGGGGGCSVTVSPSAGAPGAAWLLLLGLLVLWTARRPE